MLDGYSQVVVPWSHHDYFTPHRAAADSSPGRAAEAVARADPPGRLRGLRAARRRRRARYLSGLTQRRDHGGGDLRAHWRGRRPDVGAAQPGRGRELRRRVRHDGCGRRGGTRGRRQQYTRRADRLRGRHCRRSDDRHDAAVLVGRPVCAGGAVARRRDVSADAAGQQHARGNHRARPDRWRNREAAQRLWLHDLLSQPEPGRRLRVHVRVVAGGTGKGC